MSVVAVIADLMLLQSTLIGNEVGADVTCITVMKCLLQSLQFRLHHRHERWYLMLLILQWLIQLMMMLL